MATPDYAFILDIVEAEDDLEQINRDYYMRGWTDGLPIIPPTEARVQRMLDGTRRAPQTLLGRMPPRWGDVTVEKVAINALMAGCLPDYMPVLLTAVEAEQSVFERSRDAHCPWSRACGDYRRRWLVQGRCAKIYFCTSSSAGKTRQARRYVGHGGLAKLAAHAR
jgi:hypothetical protein